MYTCTCTCACTCICVCACLYIYTYAHKHAVHISIPISVNSLVLGALSPKRRDTLAGPRMPCPPSPWEGVMAGALVESSASTFVKSRMRPNRVRGMLHGDTGRPTSCKCRYVQDPRLGQQCRQEGPAIGSLLHNPTGIGISFQSEGFESSGPRSGESGNCPRWCFSAALLSKSKSGLEAVEPLTSTVGGPCPNSPVTNTVGNCSLGPTLNTSILDNPGPNV